jgi:Holliday junction resolvasome RuvABC endonuclease subunit
MKYLIAVDPGVVSGWAIMTIEMSPILVKHGKVDFRKKQRSSVALLAAASEQFVFSAMAIEDQFLGMNVKSLITLARNSGRWLEAAAYYSIPKIEFVAPATWISAELGLSLRRKQIELMAKRKVDALYGVVKRSEHENSAILIGRYLAVKEAQEGLRYA